MKFSKILLPIFCVLPFLIWIYKFITIDISYDEAHSLYTFAIVTFYDTFFHYPAPNNHIFYNFTTQIITRILNIREVTVITEHVYILRSFQAIITILIAFYIYKVMNIIFKNKYNIIIILILFTTIPFMNYSLQLRGYNISSLFVILIIYYIIKYIELRNKKHLIFILISSTLLMYTIPSNIYILASILGMLILIILYQKIYETNFNNEILKVIIAIFIGLILSIILYSPILSKVINNRFAAKEATDFFYSIKLIPKLSLDFLSKRYLLIGLFLFGIWLIIFRLDRKMKIYFLSTVFLFICPFILSFIHQKEPFERVFVPVSPIFTILLSMPIIIIINYLKNKILQISICFLIALYCIITFDNEIKNNNIEIENKISKYDIFPDKIYQLFWVSESFKLNETIKYLIKNENIRNVLVYDHVDLVSLKIYLEINNVNHKYIHADHEEEFRNELKNNDTTMIITSYKNKLMSKLKDYNELKNVTIIKDDFPVTNVVMVVKK
jgi:hypothetical protein